MVDPARCAKVLREFEQELVPDYDALPMPSADKRAPYAPEHIAFRVARRAMPVSYRRRDRVARAKSVSHSYSGPVSHVALS